MIYRHRRRFSSLSVILLALVYAFSPGETAVADASPACSMHAQRGARRRSSPTKQRRAPDCTHLASIGKLLPAA